MIRLDIVRYRNGAFLPDEDEVAGESRVSIVVNGTEVAGLMALPVDLEALAIGFLYSECHIDRPSDILETTIDAANSVVQLVTNRSDAFPAGESLKTMTSGCGRNISRISDDYLTRFTPVATVIRHDITVILSAVRVLTQHSSLFRDTGGVHTVGLWFDHQFQWICDDIGRHNAFDKVIGYALKSAWPLPDDSMIISTGRISSDIVLKTIRAGIPLLVSRSAPTANAIRLAESYGITLIGFARLEHCNIYSHFQRIDSR